MVLFFPLLCPKNLYCALKTKTAGLVLFSLLVARGSIRTSSLGGAGYDYRYSNKKVEHRTNSFIRVPHKEGKCNEAYPSIFYIATFDLMSIRAFRACHFRNIGVNRVYATKQLEEGRAEARGVLQNQLVEVREEVRPSRVPLQRG